MKQPPSASGRKLSRLCKLLLVAAGFKICLLGGLAADSLFNNLSFSDKNAAPTQNTGTAAKNPPQQTLKLSDASVAYAATAPQNATAPAPQAADSALSRDALNRKQEELARKEQDLRALEKEINSRLEEMQVLEQRLQIMLKDAEETKDSKFRHLVDVLSNMKAREAAKVLETLDERIAVRVLADMRGRQAGEILTYVNPVKAAKLSESLARMLLPYE